VTKNPMSSFGKKVLGKALITKKPQNTKNKVIAIIFNRCDNTQDNIFLYFIVNSIKKFSMVALNWFCFTECGDKNFEHIMGDKVSATNPEMITATASVNAKDSKICATGP